MYQTAAATSHARRLPDEPQGPPPEAPADDCEAAATLACRTPIGSETLGADGKAAGVLTLLGLMFTVVARFGPEVAAILRGGGVARAACAALVLGFAGCALAAVVQAFRTISPRFCKAKPSLAFFAEIARLPREEYVDRVEAMTMRDAVGQILSYNHTAATICAEKFKQLRRCLRCFEIASACWALLAALLVIQSLRG
jgi:hypothetical protein